MTRGSVGRGLKQPRICVTRTVRTEIPPMRKPCTSIPFSAKTQSHRWLVSREFLLGTYPSVAMGGGTALDTVKLGSHGLPKTHSAQKQHKQRRSKWSPSQGSALCIRLCFACRGFTLCPVACGLCVGWLHVLRAAKVNAVSSEGDGHQNSVWGLIGRHHC